MAWLGRMGITAAALAAASPAAGQEANLDAEMARANPATRHYCRERTEDARQIAFGTDDAIAAYEQYLAKIPTMDREELAIEIRRFERLRAMSKEGTTSLIENSERTTWARLDLLRKRLSYMDAGTSWDPGNSDLARIIAELRKDKPAAAAKYRDQMTACLESRNRDPDSQWYSPEEYERRAVAVMPDPAIDWSGTWWDKNNRYEIFGGDGRLTVSYRSRRADLNQSASLQCTLVGIRAECNGNGSYEDSDKSIAYQEHWLVTLEGNTISGSWSLPKATASWKVNAGYTPALHTGASGNFSISKTP